ncbi:cyclophilin-like fold protein [Paenibacillus sp. DMB5]|uniref:cyclophilin-like fold protein n=1 Tax=Paenibacillus sp. DMB5 TaxID=1780103 RepID=UPI00076D8B5F|nr:cyclophilin-like fold protein [Paenibacillus sp. DMB5]KUP22559.1 hypothetical protein AWJ19_31765 [Paenibacillus sp. DMB5]
MQITVQSNENTIVFELNNSRAVKDLINQLPIFIEVQNYSDNEKIFYPPQPLDTSDAPEATGSFGSLAYYAPWDDVVMLYGSFRPSPGSGLYELGHAISGSENIRNLTGTIKVSSGQ